MKNDKRFLKTYSRNFTSNWKFRTGISFFFCLIIFIAVYFNSGIYSQNIGKIQDIHDEEGVQTVIVEVVNGEHKGKLCEIKNVYDNSLVYDEKYSEGNFVFLSDSLNSITGVKRDYMVVATAMIMIVLMIAAGGRKGIGAVICLAFNICIFTVMMYLYLKGIDILFLSAVASLAFAFLVLAFISGFSGITVVSWVVTAGTAAVVACFVYILLYIGPPIRYEYLDFIPEPYTMTEGNRFFVSQIIVGCLGAVIDVSVTVTSCASELIRKNPDISAKKMMDSVREIADDITGTMINVVFFTNIAATIPVFLISMKNDIRMITVIKSNAFFEITRFLAEGTAVLLAIPLSAGAAVLFLKGGKKECG